MVNPDTRHWTDDEGSHIDVRGLPAPEPMVAILTLLERDAEVDKVIVHHDRDPIFLYPELAERGWSHRHIPGDPGEVRLLLTRNR